ncbi:MAG: F0F1 ATP synthase subunit alpha, partial [Ignavibacteria bacterium]|nr:F0F1 ATP synthase subunit alpha [Ignavibacteria bacterium]
NVGISVSRVGGNAQIKAMKKISGTLRLDLAQFRELESFAKFGSDLDKATQQQLKRGERLVEVLKQPQYVPMDIEKQVVIIFAATNGYLDEIAVSGLREYELQLLSEMENLHSGILDEIRTRKEMTDDTKAKLEKVLKDFTDRFKESK